MCGMRRDYVKWYSPSLHRDMELLAYGDHGFPVVVFPTSGGRFFEYEERGMIHALAPKIEAGGLQVIAVDTGPDVRTGLTARVTRDGTTYEIALADLAFDPASELGRVVAAYRRWQGHTP